MHSSHTEEAPAAGLDSWLAELKAVALNFTIPKRFILHSGERTAQGHLNMEESDSQDIDRA